MVNTLDNGYLYFTFTSKMDPALLCKLFYNTGAIVSIAGIFHMPFRDTIMNYGSRLTTSPGQVLQRHGLSHILQAIASFQVPHSWFTHYYIAAVTSALFWGLQIFVRGKALEVVAAVTPTRASSMSINQVFLVWLLWTIQGVRRLYECLFIHKHSNNTMWAGLWIIGIGFYIVSGIAIWIEGIGKLESHHLLSLLTQICRCASK